MPSPGDLPNPGIEPSSPALRADSLLTEQPGKPLPPICSVMANDVMHDKLKENHTDIFSTMGSARYQRFRSICVS